METHGSPISLEAGRHIESPSHATLGTHRISPAQNRNASSPANLGRHTECNPPQKDDRPSTARKIRNQPITQGNQGFPYFQQDRESRPTITFRTASDVLQHSEPTHQGPLFCTNESGLGVTSLYQTQGVADSAISVDSQEESEHTDGEQPMNQQHNQQHNDNERELNSGFFDQIPSSTTTFDMFVQYTALKINEKASSIKKKYPVAPQIFRTGQFPRATTEMFPWLSQMTPGLPYVFESEKTKLIKAQVPHLHSFLQHFLGLPSDQTLYDVNHYLQKFERAPENQWT